MAETSARFSISVVSGLDKVLKEVKKFFDVEVEHNDQNGTDLIKYDTFNFEENDKSYDDYDDDFDDDFDSGYISPTKYIKIIDMITALSKKAKGTEFKGWSEYLNAEDGYKVCHEFLFKDNTLTLKENSPEGASYESLKAETDMFW